VLHVVRSSTSTLGTPHFLTMIGGQHVMLRKFEPVAFLQAIERYKVTRVLAVPAISTRS